MIDHKTSLGPVDRRVLDALDLRGLRSLVSELVRIPSVGGAERPAQIRVARWMEENGLSPDAWEVDLEELSGHHAYSSEIARTEALGVVGVLGGHGPGRDLIFNGHVDVVPPGDASGWSFDPWDGGERDGHIQGRGALDMKGGLAAALCAAKAIADAGVRLHGRLFLQSVVAEEDGGAGTLAALQRGYRADAAVIMEPTGMAICPAQAGSLNFRITVKGRAVHGCVRDAGISALEKFQVVHRELLDLETRRNHAFRDPLFRRFERPLSLSVGTIQGGDWPSTVPDWVRVEGRYGVAPDESVDDAREMLEDSLLRCAEGDPWLRENPPELEWWGGTFLPARIPEDAPIIAVLQESLLALGRNEAPLEGVTYGSDMRLLVGEGRIPTVLFGPGDVRGAHAADESVPVDELEWTARTLALAALRFCGY